MHPKLKDLHQLLEIQGILPGDKKYDDQMLAMKVDLCREHLGMPTCDDCQQYDDCSLVKELRIKQLYSTPDQDSNY